jgi:hypothetical protein
MKSDEQKIRRATWRKIVDEYLSIDLTQKAFCEQRNISLPQFVYYHGQFRRENEPQAEISGFVPVKIPHYEKSVTANEIKLSLPNGFQCTFPIHTYAAQLKRLVEVLLSC